MRELGAGAAEDALEQGRVSAVLTIPDGFIADLQSGVRRPELTLDTGARDADRGRGHPPPARGRGLPGQPAAGAATYVDQVLRLVDLVIDGGRISVFGLSGEALGLGRSRVLVERMQRGAARRAATGRWPTGSTRW